MTKITISPIVHELKVVAARDKGIRYSEIFCECTVNGFLVIPCEVVTFVANAERAPFNVQHRRRALFCRSAHSCFLIYRCKRIIGKDKFDIRYKQLLMLLFMVETDGHK